MLNDTQSKFASAIADRYRIQREIGAGGMATVYLAHDIKHGRAVAVKVLEPELGAVLGTERFLSEIQVTAKLQHPHLLPLFDSGEAEGLLFYVMPYVEGESLRAKLDREKQLPVDEVVRIGAAIASALDYAHRHGVIHRDLKPENILLHEGQPMVADFGIALAVRNAGGNRITQTGLSLGTPQYMSPEQATGDRAIDARTDVYSLGAIVYEMLTGEPPHTGASSQAIIARLMTERPREIRVNRPSVPEYVQAAVERALEKLPADRFATAKEFGDALTGERATQAPTRATTISAAATPVVPHGTTARRAYLVAALALVAAIAVAAFAAWRGAFRSPVPAVPARFVIERPADLELSVGAGGKVAITRDGRMVAFTALAATQPRGLYVRRMDDPSVTYVQGSDVAGSQVFSPDNQWLMFASGGSIRIVPVTGGTPKVVVPRGSSPSWGDNGVVAFMRDRGVWVTTADGGTPRLVGVPDSVSPDAYRRFTYVHLLPGAEHALVAFTRQSFLVDSQRIGVLSLEDGTLQELGVQGSYPRYASGHLIFARTQGELFAAPFSLRKRQLTGAPILLLQGVWQGPGGATGFDVAENGTLVYQEGSNLAGTSHLLKVSKTGAIQVLTSAPAQFTDPRLSPDGQRVVVRLGPVATGGDLWIYDITSKALTRLTSDSTANRRGVWSHDGRRVYYFHRFGDSTHVIARYWDRSGVDSIVARGTDEGAEGLLQLALGAPAGPVAFRIGSDITNPNIGYAPFNDWDKRTLIPMASTAQREANPTISPDGRLLAYTSNETGVVQVYVTPIPGPGPRVPVSIGVGGEPMWARRGSTLYYRTPEWMMAAEITSSPTLNVTKRDSLFRDDFVRYTWHQAYDLFPDGDFLMMGRQTGTAEQRNEVRVLTHWPELLRRQRGAR